VKRTTTVIADDDYHEAAGAEAVRYEQSVGPVREAPTTQTTAERGMDITSRDCLAHPPKKRNRGDLTATRH